MESNVKEPVAVPVDKHGSVILPQEGVAGMKAFLHAFNGVKVSKQ